MFMVFSLVEFKIYISLKLIDFSVTLNTCLVEFKIYISLKHNYLFFLKLFRLVEFKIYISLKPEYGLFEKWIVQQNSRFTYLSNQLIFFTTFFSVQQNSRFTYLSNLKLRFGIEILNLGIKKWTDTDPARRQFR